MELFRQSHSQYVKSLSERLQRWLRRQSRRIDPAWVDAAQVLLRLNLDPARPILAPLYAPVHRGQPPHDPLCMLRALLLMLLLGGQSIPRWAQTLRTQPRLALIAGFEPYQTPSVGAFYLFIDRLENGPYSQRPPDPQKLPSRWRKGLFRRNLKAEKERAKAAKKAKKADGRQEDSVTQHLKEQLLQAADQPRPQDLQARLEDLLIRCAIIPSAQKGFLDLKNLTLFGDGSPLPSGANSWGKPTCDCRSRGIYRCDHDRLYTDPTANWGYDHYRKLFFFGHWFYQHCAVCGGHDLPFPASIAPGGETDFTASLNNLDRLIKALAENGAQAQIQRVVYDAGHDALGIYRYGQAKQISLVIALNSRRKESFNLTGTAQRIDEQGAPLCPAGLPMRLHSHDPRRHRLYYNCPAKRPTRRKGRLQWVVHRQECPQAELCQPQTRMGPVIYTRTQDDPRLYPSIPRHSQQFQDLMDHRSGCERSNSLKKVAYHLGKKPCRNAVHYLVRLCLADLLQHAKAWLAEDRKQVGDDPIKLLEVVHAA